MTFIDAATTQHVSFDSMCNTLSAITGENDDCTLYLGADSQLSNTKLTSVIAIVLYRERKGGRLFYRRTDKALKRTITLKHRLSHEIQTITDIAMKIADAVSGVNIIVHLDINQNKQHKSSIMMNEAINYVTAQGFKCEIKPNSWCASTVADKYTKPTKIRRH